MKGQNIFLNKDKSKFVNFTCWKDNFGYFILPTILLDRKIPLSASVETNRISIFFLKYRLTIDCVTQKKIEKTKEKMYDNINDFIVWYNDVSDLKLTQEKLIFILDKQVDLRNFIQESDMSHYYSKKIFMQKIKPYMK